MTAVRRYYPDAEHLEPEAERPFRLRVLGADGRELGILLDTTPISKSNIGYAGPVPCAIALDPEDKILGVFLLDNLETPSFLHYIEEMGFFGQWNGLSVREAVDHPVDAVSGATKTAAAIIRSVRQTLALECRLPKAPASTWRRTCRKLFLPCLTLTLGLLSFCRPHRWRRVRPILLAANVSILGLLSGALLSLAAMQNWLAHGMSASLSVLTLMAGAALLLPWLTGRDYYCTYVCPFGSAQELLGLLWRGRRPRLPHWLLRLLHAVRFVVLLGALAVAVGAWTSDLSRWEPFIAFQWRSVPPTIVIAALILLLLAIAIPRFWCRTLCPTGCLLQTWRPRKDSVSASPASSGVGIPSWCIPVLLFLALLLALPSSVRPHPDAPIGNEQVDTTPISPPAPPARSTDGGKSLIGISGVPIALTDQSMPPNNPPKKDIISVIRDRKDVREYTDEPVTTEQLSILLRAGMAIPSVGHAQPWAFVVVTDRQPLNELAAGLASGTMLTRAKAAIVVCGDMTKALPGKSRSFWIQDCAASAQNILLAAEGIGLGAFRIEVFPEEKPVHVVRTVCRLPDNVVPLCVISIGHPLGVESPNDTFRTDNIHWNTW